MSSESGTRHRLIVIVVVGIVAAGAISGYMLQRAPGHRDHGRLAIDIVDLPEGRGGAVVVRGPDGFRSRRSCQHESRRLARHLSG